MDKDQKHEKDLNIDPFRDEEVENKIPKEKYKATKKVLKPEDISFSLFIYKKIEKGWDKAVDYKNRWVKLGLNKIVRKYSLIFFLNILLLLVIMPTFQSNFIPSVADIPELQREISNLKNQIEKQSSSISTLETENQNLKNSLAQKHELVEKELKNIHNKLITPQNTTVKVDSIDSGKSEGFPFIGSLMSAGVSSSDFDTVWNTLLQKMLKGEPIQVEANTLVNILPKPYRKFKNQFDNLATFSQSDITSIEGLSKELVFFKGRLLNEPEAGDTWYTKIWYLLKEMITIDTAHKTNKVLIKDQSAKELTIKLIDQAQANLQNGKITEAILDIESINSSEVKHFKNNWITSAKRVIAITKIVNEIQVSLSAEKSAKK